jgi:hypothetical protein
MSNVEPYTSREIANYREHTHDDYTQRFVATIDHLQAELDRVTEERDALNRCSAHEWCMDSDHAIVRRAEMKAEARAEGRREGIERERELEYWVRTLVTFAPQHWDRVRVLLDAPAQTPEPTGDNNDIPRAV